MVRTRARRPQAFRSFQAGFYPSCRPLHGRPQTADRRPCQRAASLAGLASGHTAALQGRPTLMRRFMSFRDFDWALLSMVLAICTVSVFEIYSATLHTKYADLHAHTKQTFWITGGLVAMFLFSKIDYHRLLDWIPWAYGASLLALVAVKLVGHKVLGAKRWISIGPMHFQPSEWVKLILILAVARYFANLGGRSLSTRDILKALLLVFLPMALVLIEPDLGTSLTYIPILAAGLFLGGINIRQSLVLLTCGVVLIVGVW